MPVPGSIPVTIRSFNRLDAEACRTLYVQGLIGGSIAENDTGFDIDDIESAYLKKPGDHFWVAVAPQGEVVGMIGVQNHEQGVGEIRRLRVRQDRQRRGIGTQLVERAVQFCKEHGYIKVRLDTFMRREPSIGLFEKFGFQLSRSRTVGDKELRDFYLDLYRSARSEEVQSPEH